MRGGARPARPSAPTTLRASSSDAPASVRSFSTSPVDAPAMRASCQSTRKVARIPLFVQSGWSPIRRWLHKRLSFVLPVFAFRVVDEAQMFEHLQSAAGLRPSHRPHPRRVVRNGRCGAGVRRNLGERLSTRSHVSEKVIEFCSHVLVHYDIVAGARQLGQRMAASRPLRLLAFRMEAGGFCLAAWLRKRPYVRLGNARLKRSS